MVAKALGLVGGAALIWGLGLQLELWGGLHSAPLPHLTTPSPRVTTHLHLMHAGTLEPWLSELPTGLEQHFSPPPLSQVLEGPSPLPDLLREILPIE